MKAFSDVAQLVFNQSSTRSSETTIAWGVTAEDTGYLGVDFPGNDGSTAVSDVVVFNAEYLADGAAAQPGSYYYLTFIHELGHAMGLAHPHNGGPFGYNGYESSLPWSE